MAYDKAQAHFPPRVFSGMQPSGDLHLGNYLGALRNFIALQKNYQCMYCIVDMHAITVWQNPQELRHATRVITAAYLASGLDPKTSIIFNQSRVPQHAELAWIFNCIARIGWLNRMTQFKDKAGKNRENASVGLYIYPNLMAADILAYHGTLVPVGEDQKQHLELTRDIAIKFNNDFNIDFFPTPEPLIIGAATRVMSLRDGTQKMSKSDPSDYSRICLMDDADKIALKIRRAKTDALPIPATSLELADRPDAKNLLNIYAALHNTTLEEALPSLAGTNFQQFKTHLVEITIETLGHIRVEMQHLLADTSFIDKVLQDGAERAGAIATPILAKTREIVGFL